MVKYRKSCWGRPNYIHKRSRWWNSPEIGTRFFIHGNRIPIVSHPNPWFFLTQFCSSDDVPKAEDLEESLFVKCHCKSCRDPRKCECQSISDVVDAKGKKRIAYDMQVSTRQISFLHYYSSVQGLFAIDVIPGLMVIECNKVSKSSPLCIPNIHSQCCQCDISCPNRVSQRPRKIPIDIFKTTDRGWGARPLCDVRKGTVLGMYTGYDPYFNYIDSTADWEWCCQESNVISSFSFSWQYLTVLRRRCEAEELDDEERTFCFDLDGQENLYEDGSDQLQAYTVTSWMCGK